MFSIDYRLSIEAKFPAALEDVEAAVGWLRANGSYHGIAADRIGLWGSSSGGHLAALAALCRRVEVQAVVDGYGPIDFLQMDAQRSADNIPSDDPESVKLPPDMRSASPDSFESLFLGAPITEVPDLVRQANPASFARPDAPPFLILHGLSDSAVPAGQSVLLYDALAAYSNDVTLCLIHGLGHGFLNRNHLDDGPARKIDVRGKQRGREGQGIFSRIEEFFREHLREM